jgi:ribonuclease BN (tRNA processing enzyme)
MPDHEVYERNEVERQRATGKSVSESLKYAREQDEKVIEFIHGADVYIADSQYNAAEYASRAGWGHTCVDDTVAMAIRADVRQLFLFHHDPDHADDVIAEMVTRAQAQADAAGSALVVTAAREGLEVELGKPVLESRSSSG